MSLAPESVDALVDWYQRTARDLPWRRSRDPYRILVSEIMLQQTRVETVEPRFERFVERFPDLPALAAADEQEVLAEWSGLGYYRRARFLHRLARVVVEEHAGTLPADASTLRGLPGIGEYTAAAVSSIAHDRPDLAIDGNIERVLCRLLALVDDPRRAATKRRLREAAHDALRAHPAGAVNQALMDLGARVCIPTAPRCGKCPVERWCAARAAGIETTIPAPRKTAIQRVEEAAAVVERDGELLLFRGQRPGALTEMWEFPTLDSRLRPSTVVESAELQAQLRDYMVRCAAPVSALRPLGTVRHGITTRRITCHVFLADPSAPPPSVAAGHDPERGWFDRSEIEALPLAAATRKILTLLDSAAQRLGF